MAPSLVEKYDLILAADPRSRVFVELARALLERGENARAVEVCQRGLEHHPGSIQGRILWGRGLLAAGDVDGALAQFEAAAGIEPQNPYAVNLGAEALVERGLHGRARLLLERAAALQPSNERIRGWLEEARRQAPAESAAEKAAPPPAAEARAPAVPAEPAAAGAPAAQPPAPPPSLSPRPAVPPPPLPAGKREDGGRFGIDALPEQPRPRTSPAPEKTPGPDEAERIAATYERELRAKLLDAPQTPPSFLRRHWVAMLALAVLVLGGGGGGLTYWLVRRANRAAEVKAYVESARKGLARDTLGSLRESAKVLAEARSLDREHREATSLSAQVAAVLAADFGDPAARELAHELGASGRAGEGAVAAQVLLASTDAERAAAADALLALPLRTGPLLQTLAARALLERGDPGGALNRLEQAAKGTPPSLRALAAMGDFYRERGDVEQALSYYRAALSAHGTHPRSAVGAAEARLALGRELSVSLAELRAVAADPASVPPLADRLRFELALARVLAAQGEVAAAADRLDRAFESLGPRPEIPAAQAEIFLAAAAYDKAESAARRAVRLAPKETAYRVLLARAQAGRGRYRELLRDSEGQGSREMRLHRGIAQYELHAFRQAMAELERTRRDGKMPAEAATYYALAEYAVGRKAQGMALLEKLAALPNAPAVAFVAKGHLDLARGSASEAEEEYRAALARDPQSLEAHCALGRLLLSRGQAREARASLERAVALNPFHAEARLALGSALLQLGEPAQARDAFQQVLGEEPKNGAALRGLSTALLADRNPAAARAAAERALEVSSGNPETWVVAARAALARGDAATARREAERALKMSPKGPSAAAARKVLEQAKRAGK
jgi:Tfp pilus assembly protein PilF